LLCWSPFFAGGTEIGKYKLFLLLIPLYTKIRREEVLDKYLRGKIHGYIVANPGCHYSMIKQNLKLHNGTLTHHLHMLERNDFIYSKRDGLLKRFYSQDVKVPNGKFYPTSIQESILTVIQKNPGISQSELARQLGMRRQVVGYHVKILRNAKQIKLKRIGKVSKLYRRKET
jgi:predicted transcriptional regulator